MTPEEVNADSLLWTYGTHQVLLNEEEGLAEEQRIVTFEQRLLHLRRERNQCQLSTEL